MKGKKLLVGILIATLISCGGVFFVLNKNKPAPSVESTPGAVAEQADPQIMQIYNYYIESFQKIHNYFN